MVIEKTQYGGLSLVNAEVGDVLMVSRGRGGVMATVTLIKSNEQKGNER